MPGERNADRERCVKALNKIAASIGVERTSNNAGKAKVEELIERVRQKVEKSGWTSEADEDVWEQTTVAYHGTWSQQCAEVHAEASEDPEVEWKFMAFQATYNCTDGEWTSVDRRAQAALFDRFKTFALALGLFLEAVGISITLEWATKTMQHLHIHLYMHLKKAFHRRGRDALSRFAFETIHPHLEANRASGKCFLGAVRFGHFYVYVDKIGSVLSWSDFLPFQDYGVEGWWLDNLLKQGKLHRDVYLKWAAQVGVGFQRRLGDMMAADRYEKERAAEEAACSAAADLADSVLPLRSFQEVDRFLDFFSRGGRFFRRPMLAIIGGTNLGKSVLAADVLRRVGLLVDVPSFLEITVEQNPSLDFAEFDSRKHSGVLLDGVGDALILKSNRESLQWRAKLSKGGQSATNMYAYKYTLARRAIVATFDLSAKNLEQFEQDHWLSCDLNVIVLRLREKAYLEAVAPSVPEVPPFPLEDRPGKRRWLNSPARTALSTNACDQWGR